ncbi:hypothetical protein A2U01_0009797 [Trifolium medium]|uniref:Uncharacterized protein n=1 Tax=Trifolium medium TaxID=97028 RepID=A0A392MRJ5_9FABA|nr:hypothetical protein [Trifolium medium]
MDSPPYHYYHHYDPTIINIHTLLKPQAYQQPTYFNTPSPHLSQYISPPSMNIHISPTHTYPNFTSPSHLHDDLRSSLQQLFQSQQKFQQTLSDFATEVSLLKTTLTPFIHHKPLSNSTNLQSHNGYQEPMHQQPHLSLLSNQHSTITTTTRPFNITHVNTHSATYQDHTSQFHLPTTYSPSTTTIPSPWVSYTPFIQLPPIYNSNVHRSSAFQDPLHHTNHPSSHTEHELVVDNNFFPSTDSNSHSTFTVSETDEKFETCDEVTEDNFTPTVVSQAVEEENKFAPDLIINFNPVSDSVKEEKRRVFESLQKFFFTVTSMTFPEKTVASTVVVTAPLPQHLFIFDSGGDDRRVCSLATILGNGIRAFDPGGDERNFGSPVLILTYIDSLHHAIVSSHL